MQDLPEQIATVVRPLRSDWLGQRFALQSTAPIGSSTVSRVMGDYLESVSAALPGS